MYGIGYWITKGKKKLFLRLVPAVFFIQTREHLLGNACVKDELASGTEKKKNL